MIHTFLFELEEKINMSYDAMMFCVKVLKPD